MTESAPTMCHACGRSWALSPDSYSDPSIHEFSAEGGYGGSFPEDLEHLKWTCCGECLKKWLDTFVVQPLRFERSLAHGGYLIEYATGRLSA